MVMKSNSFSTARKVRDAIDTFDDDELFTTQQLLYLGGRAAIDAELSHMVRHEGLTRVTRGVFVKKCSGNISASEVAFVKAIAFGKMIYQHGLAAAFEVEIIDDNPNKNGVITFYTSGCTSSFKFGNYTVRFVSASARKRELPDNPTGKILKAVWELGQKRVKKTMVRARHAKFKFNRKYNRIFRRYILKTPLWVVTAFYPTLA